MPKFITKKWVGVRHQSGNLEKSQPSKPIGFRTSMLRSDLCDFSDAYIVVKGEVAVAGGSNASKKIDLQHLKAMLYLLVALKINNTLIDNAEDLNIAMPMYNLIEYSKNQRKTTGSLRNYYRDELSNDTNNNNNPNKNVIKSESFKYKTIITESTYNGDAKITVNENQVNNPDYDANKSGKKEFEIAVKLKQLSNFWKALKITLINCEVSLILTWSRKRVITSMERRVITNT